MSLHKRENIFDFPENICGVQFNIANRKILDFSNQKMKMNAFIIL